MTMQGSVAARSASNPFGRQGVVSFGVRQKTAVFDYMRSLKDDIAEYLRAETGVTGDDLAPLAITGIHGSGKTHILTWLAEEVGQVSSARATCVYAKADSDSFADLYRQWLNGLSRPFMITLISDAIRALAEAKIRTAEISEGLASNIRSAASLEPYQAGNYLDASELERNLRRELAKLTPPPPKEEAPGDAPGADLPESPPTDTPVPPKFDRAKSAGGFASTMAQVLLLVDNAECGEAAFTWLQGQTTSDPIAPGVAQSLFSLAETGQRSSADTAAIDALESVAALFRLAERPLVIMIDQAEVIVRSSPDSARTETVYSLLKKLIEQLRGQGALVIIAGVPDFWDGVRRDVWPRLSGREPTPIGHLTLDEIRLLLEAYTGDIRGLSPPMLMTLRSISGGIPREVVRIGFQIFAQAGADWSTLSIDDLKAGAADAGTIRDRERFALEVVDKVLSDYEPALGGIQRDLPLKSGMAVRRLLHSAAGQTLAFTMLGSTDPLTEANAASYVATLVRGVHEEFPTSLLFVIAIGYSTEEVQTILQPTAVVLAFDEKRFEGDLRLELVKRARADVGKSQANGDAARLSKALSELDKKLSALSSERAIAANVAETELAERLEENAAGATQVREIRSRWELIDVLDRIEAEQQRADLMAERRLMRGVMVANEISIHSPMVDYGGSLYMDLIDDQLRADDGEYRRELRLARSKIVSILRRHVRPKSATATFLERPVFVGGAGLAGVVILTIVVTWFYREAIGFGRRLNEDLMYVGVVASTWVTVPIYLSLFAQLRVKAPFRTLERDLYRLRAFFEPKAKGEL